MRTLLAVLALSALPAPAVDFGLQVGALEVVLLPPAHGGLYPYVGAAVSVPVGGGFTFVGSLSLEWSFEFARGGLVAVATLDYALSDRVGLDLNAVFIHDQPGLQFRDADFFAGGGPGVSFFFGKWVLSPFFSVLAGLDVGGVSLVPGLNLTRNF